MAAAVQRCFRQILSNTKTAKRSLHLNASPKTTINYSLVAGSFGGVALACCLYAKSKQWRPQMPVLFAKEKKETKGERPLVSYREQRFLTFASVELDGNVYMTPQDFLESVTEEHPRPRIGRTGLQIKEVEKQLKSTPTRYKGSNKFFRSMHTKGLISYTEYLFLLCVLTKPHSGFRIAFNMFDTDGNQRVDKKEFLVLESVMMSSSYQETETEGAADEGGPQDGLEKLMIGPSKRAQGDGELVDLFGCTFNKEQTVASEMQPVYERGLWQTLKGSSNPRLEKIITEHKLKMAAAAQQDSVEEAKPQPPPDVSTVQDTTLLVHFFGLRGNDTLRYEDFHRFMDNLQTEVLELEFNEFSKGMPTITEEEFARVLLRYTTLSAEDYTEYLLRLRSRILQSKGITFKDFKDFCQFLNNLDDFAIVMTMYTFADQPVSQDEFKRAVHVCTGQVLNPHLVDTVFQLFDIDGDGHLSFKEFISIMKDRLHRGFRSHLLKQSSWETFKNCLKNEMRKS